MPSTDTTRDAILKGLALSSEIYSATVSAQAQSLWLRLLAKFQPDDVKRAFGYYMENGPPFMPKPSDIVKHIRGTGSDRATEAWGKVMDGLKYPGRYQTVTFDDGIIHACIERMGGWIRLGGMDVSEEPFRAKEFKDLYESYLQRPPHSFPGRLVGIHEASDVTGGHKVERKPFLIGDQQKAMKVLENKGTTRQEVAQIGSVLPMLPKKVEGED